MANTLRHCLGLLLVVAVLVSAPKDAVGDVPASVLLITSAGDSISIRTADDCAGTCLTIESLSESPMGIRSVRLLDGVNAKVRSIDPFPMTGAAEVRVCAAPIDPTKDASATFAIRFESGDSTFLPFDFIASNLVAAPAELSFGEIRSATRDTLEVTLTNATARTEIVRRLALFNPAFRIIEPPALPLTLAPESSITLRLEATATGDRPAEVDTLRVDYCSRTRVPLRVEVADPSSAAPAELASATALEAISPNPTDGATAVRYSLARPGRVTIVLYDERGARVVTLLDAQRASGSHTVTVDASQLAPGVYHVRLESAGVGRGRSFIRK